jgi:methionyl aminopeptidase
MIEIKTPGELDAMRAAGLVVARTLALLAEHVKAGVSTAELDELAQTSITEAGAVPSFKGYQGFPASICASINEQVVHGIPAADQVLADGDLISIDCGAILEGWHGDSAVTVGVGEVSAADRALSAATRQAMLTGLAAATVGARLGDVSHAIETAVHEAEAASDGLRFGIVSGYGGHGIGTAMHMDPFVPNHGRAGHGVRLRAGMALAIEPMLIIGDSDIDELDDGWTVVTADGSRAAHWEHSVAITDDGPWVLTAPEDGSETVV